MLEPYERATNALYILNCLKHYPSLPAKIRLLSTVYDADNGISAGSMPKWHPKLISLDARRRPGSDTSEANGQTAEWRELAKRQIRLIEELAAKRTHVKPSGLERRILAIAEIFKLTPVDVEVLGALVRHDQRGFVRSILDEVNSSSRYRDKDSLNIALMLGMPQHRVFELVQKSALVDCGLLIVDDDGELMLNSQLSVLLRTGWRSEKQLFDTLLGRSAGSTLRWEHYDHIRGHRDHLAALLGAALKRGEKGINILIYGAPGTGKTEFSKTLAAKLGAAIYPVGEGAVTPIGRDRGDEPDRSERLSSLRMAQRLMSGRKKVLLLVDEASDVLDDFIERKAMRMFFGGDQRSRASKVFLNRTLENTPVPTIWVMNHAGGLSQAIVRRFTYVFELPVPSLEARAEVWTRLLKQHGFKPADGDGMLLARQYDVAPAVAETAVKAAGLAGRELSVVHKTMRSLQRALTGRDPAPTGDMVAEAKYDASLLVSKPDIADLSRKLKARGMRRCTILLSGKPGTGKSAYARALANDLGMEVLHVRCSDIIDMYLGESERKISEAFARARDNGLFLVIDEADALLQSRGRAVRSWEVSQVAEMLTWLESHPYPMCFTVNSTEQLDEASLRRFDYKVEVLPLKPEMCARAFEVFFGFQPVGPAERRLASLDGLTPGDFTVVARRAKIEGLVVDVQHLSDASRASNRRKASPKSKPSPNNIKHPDATSATQSLVEMLEHELAAKPDSKTVMGFSAMRR